jgi:hypothetical protein
MNKFFQAAALLPILTTAFGIGFAAPSLAEKPSLGDGIFCIAGKRSGLLFTTSEINDASISQKQPVSIKILQRQGGIGVGDVVIYDRTKNSVTFADLESAREYTPEATPVGAGTVTYTGNNTFTGKTSTGAPLSLTLSKGYGALTLTHQGQTYKGVCH